MEEFSIGQIWISEKGDRYEIFEIQNTADYRVRTQRINDNPPMECRGRKGCICKNSCCLYNFHPKIYWNSNWKKE
jgi:hypothetical protein